MDEKETLKIIKRINQRLDYFEKQGITDSYTYHTILNSLELMGIPTTQSKSGKTRISRKKTDVQQLSQGDDMQHLLDVEAMGGLKEERDLAKEVLKKRLDRNPTKAEINQHISRYGRLKQWAEKELKEVYKWVKTDIVGAAATALADIFDTGARDDTYDEIFAAIDVYEDAKKKYFAQGGSDLSEESEATAAVFTQEAINDDQYGRWSAEYLAMREKRR